MRRAALAFSTLALLAALAVAQEGYWIALNYRVVFHGNGTALVEARLHPFSIDGRSLFGDSVVEKEMNSSIPGMLNFTILMFADNPKLLRYSSVSYGKAPNETVLCDVANTGVMTEFRGAYLLSALIYLNTSSYVRAINGSLFEVKVRDSFTSMDVRSWIDVIEFRFQEAELVEYRWEPPFARGPRREGADALLWINFNEQEAPDFYVFTMRVPKFTYVGEPPEVAARILSLVCNASGLSVIVSNEGSTSGYAYVRALANGSEQARKIYLAAGAGRGVLFPSVSCDSVVVELYSGSVLLDRRELERGTVPQPETAAPIARIAVALIALAAAAGLAAAIFAGVRRRAPLSRPAG